MDMRIVLLPLFVQVALTFLLLIWLAVLRNDDLRSGRVNPASVALREPNWPPRTQQFANAFSNQFELPVLFYVLTILQVVTRRADPVFVALAWIFVATRIVHAYIHVTSNVVPRRGAWYGAGALVLMLMWLIFSVRLLFALP